MEVASVIEHLSKAKSHPNLTVANSAVISSMNCINKEIEWLQIAPLLCKSLQHQGLNLIPSKMKAAKGVSGLKDTNSTSGC